MLPARFFARPIPSRSIASLKGKLYTLGMLYFLYGENRDKARAKAHELLESLSKKRPDAEIFKIDSTNFDSAQIEELVGGQGLFSNKYLVFLDTLFDNEEAKEKILKFHKEIGASENVFIWLEVKVDKATLTKIEKSAERVQKFESDEEKSRKFSVAPGQYFKLKDFNIFSLTDALGKRDRKELWVLYREAVEREIPNEEVHGILFWQIKSMILAENSKTAKDAGLNPFVFNKARNYAKNFKKGELASLAGRFIEMYHNAHRGKRDFEIELEKFALTV